MKRINTHCFPPTGSNGRLALLLPLLPAARFYTVNRFSGSPWERVRVQRWPTRATAARRRSLETRARVQQDQQHAATYVGSSIAFVRIHKGVQTQSAVAFLLEWKPGMVFIMYRSSEVFKDAEFIEGPQSLVIARGHLIGNWRAGHWKEKSFEMLTPQYSNSVNTPLSMCFSISENLKYTQGLAIWKKQPMRPLGVVDSFSNNGHWSRKRHPKQAKVTAAKSLPKLKSIWSSLACYHQSMQLKHPHLREVS